jgi:transposase InsO family protein
MAWKKVLVMEERCSFVLLAEKSQQSFSSLCAEYGISRKTGYKWLERYRKYGLKALSELSRRPLHCPHKTAAHIEKLILNDRRNHPTWGPKKLQNLLMTEHKIISPPSQGTIGAILKRNGVPLRKRRKRGVFRLPLQNLTVPLAANEVWTVDFKGWFQTLDGARCDPLTIMDLHSRFLLCAKLLAGQTVRSSKPAFTAVFKRYGLPRVIRVDNGSPFASMGVGRLSELSVWWTHLGIRVEFIKPASPQENGAHERMHGTMKAEVTRPPSANISAQQQRLDRWRKEYNEERPHEGIGMQRPVQNYQASPRRFSGSIKPLRYPRPMKTLVVSGSGFVCWNGAACFMGEALSGSRLGLKPLDNGNHEVYFAERLLGELSELSPDRLRPLAGWIPKGSKGRKKREYRMRESVTDVPG